MAESFGDCLLVIARNALHARLGLPTSPETRLPELAQPGASFVTLTLDGDLRGCIGSLEAWRPLGDDVRANAEAAAFRDPRFPPLTRDEARRIRIEVSLLAPPRPITFTDEADALRQMHPGRDGVILEADGRRATFLPQVWESLPDPADFLAELKRKAGLPGDYHSPRLRLHVYEVRKWKENTTA